MKGSDLRNAVAGPRGRSCGLRLPLLSRESRMSGVPACGLEDAVDVCTGQVRGDQKEWDPFSSKNVEDRQDSSKARNGNEEITYYLANFSQIFVCLFCFVFFFVMVLPVLGL